MLTNNANDNLSQLIRQTSDNLESSYNIINNTSLHFLSNKTIRSWASGDVSLEEDYYNLFINKSQMEEELKYSLMFNNAWDMRLISSAYIMLNESTYCSVSRSTLQSDKEYNMDVYERLKQKIIRGMVIIPPSNYNRTIYFTRTIININKPEQYLFLIIGTDESQFSEKYEGLLEFPGAMAYIIDDNGVIYSSLDKNKLGTVIDSSILDLKYDTDVTEATLNNQKYFVASKKISDSGLTFIEGIPKTQVLGKLSDSIGNYLLITLVIVLVFLISSIFLSLRFTRFIRDLLHNINKVKIGNFHAKMPAYKDNELNLLSDTFNNMTNEIEYLINEVYKKQLLLKETEFKFLQSQMNPHFLFNTLVTIGYKARLSQDETVFKMVTSLTELLQVSIYSSSKDKVSIRQELEFVKFYLYLQKVRFEDKLEYNINISDSSILEYYLPKLCVEPIVENAVIHGLENKMGKGVVNINIRQESNSIYFEIIDDGTGFNKNIINPDSSESLVKYEKGHNSIGLNNTHKRIKLIYGEQYGIRIESELNKGSRVIIHIPVDRGDVSDV